MDKSKSTKTSLMHLLKGNLDVEGATTINACYGGTASFLNTVAWVESSEWDGRYGIVVAADIAIYDTPAARPTGGAAAVAFLVGPNAPLRIVPKTRATHASDAYDFYKPSLKSEYPLVDGQLSRVCYLRALDDCYGKTMKKLEALADGLPAGKPFTVEDAFDHFVFHSPYNKLVGGWLSCHARCPSVERALLCCPLRRPPPPTHTHPSAVRGPSCPVPHPPPPFARCNKAGSAFCTTTFAVQSRCVCAAFG